MRVSGWQMCVLLLLCVGCHPPHAEYPASLNSQRPDERCCGIRHAADTNDKSVMGVLIDRLDDEDEAVRMFAIIALERMTGTRLGYDYHATQPQRWRAIQEWRTYAAKAAATRPGTD
jgi:hypothetical protein